MYGKNQMKSSRRFLILLLVLLRLPLLFAHTRYDGFRITSFFDYQQHLILSAEAIQPEYVNRNIFMLVAYDSLARGESAIGANNYVQPEEQNESDEWNSYSEMPFSMLLGGLAVMFICFGIISSIGFFHRFARYTIIPHSIHAPPVIC